jgi:hypothetical protein
MHTWASPRIPSAGRAKPQEKEDRKRSQEEQRGRFWDCFGNHLEAVYEGMMPVQRSCDLNLKASRRHLFLVDRMAHPQDGSIARHSPLGVLRVVCCRLGDCHIRLAELAAWIDYVAKHEVTAVCKARQAVLEVLANVLGIVEKQRPVALVGVVIVANTSSQPLIVCPYHHSRGKAVGIQKFVWSGVVGRVGVPKACLARCAREVGFWRPATDIRAAPIKGRRPRSALGPMREPRLRQGKRGRTGYELSSVTP